MMSSVTIPAPNRPSVSLSTIRDAHGAGPWVHRLMENPQDIADVIYEPAGSAAPQAGPQWRPNADEFVVVIGGRYEVEIDELGTFQAEEDSYICVPKGHAARFAVQGSQPGIRVSVRQPDAQALPADGRTPAERRSAHSQLPTPTPREGRGKGPAPNQPFLTMAQLKELYGAPNWSHQVIANQSYMVNFIHNKPHDLPAGHWHSDCDEWWLIREGQLEWVFDGIGSHKVKKGDFVCAPQGYLHRIHVIGDVPAIRMPVVLFGHPSVPHLPPDILGHARRGLAGYP